MDAKTAKEKFERLHTAAKILVFQANQLVGDMDEAGLENMDEREAARILWLELEFTVEGMEDAMRETEARKARKAQSDSIPFGSGFSATFGGS